jgi:hypothetical protein
MPTSSSKTDPVARESQAIAFLDSFPRNVEPILIGGYAVAAYGRPRFSVDVDLVLPSGQRQAVESWFAEEGIRSRETLKAGIAGREISKLLITRDLVSGDVYFGGLRARETGAIVEYDWIARRPRRERLTLTTGATRRPFSVARPEALWVLKLLAGRPEDLTDLFVISEWPVDSSDIASELERLEDSRVRSHLNGVASRLATDRECADALSRRGLGSPTNPRNQKLWTKFKRQALAYLST